jgi:uncharacterized repeat protein (TIGR01451 family)
MKSRIAGVTFSVLATVLLASCTTPVSVSGPCDVASDSTITLDVAWQASSAPVGTGDLSSRRVRSQASPSRPKAEADGESMLIAIDVPAGWSVGQAVWDGTINGSPANGSAEVLGATPFCDGAFVELRGGYIRTFFKITPGVVMTTESFGRLQVTYATATLTEGVYHPLAMAVMEDGNCATGMAFHRVTVGAPELIQFDLAPILNADVVVNGTDATQDALVVTEDGPFAFVTQSVSALAVTPGPGLPDDGILRGNALEELAAASDFPIEVSECLPDIPSAIAESSDGDNAWLSTASDDAVTFSVPSRRYAELLLLLTGSAVPFGSDVELLNEVDVTVTYDDASTQVQHVIIPVGGLLSAFPPALSVPVVPTYVMGVSTTVPLPYDPAGKTAGGTINAIAVTPDPTKRVVSVTLTLTPGPPETSAVVSQNVALFAAAGMALADPEADLIAAKQLLTTGPFAVGNNVMWRVTVTNDGTGASAPVQLTDVLPASLQYVSATASDGTCSHLAGTVTCNLGVLGAGTMETVDIVTTISASGATTNTASVQATGETNVSNNSGSASLVAAAAAGAAGIPTLSTLAAAMLIGGLALLAAMRMR